MQHLEISKQAISGDHASFLQILEAHEDIYYRIAYSFMRNEHDALEAIQEFTYRSFKKIHTVRQPQFLSTWLIRILLNVCHDMKKKINRIELKEDIEIVQQENLNYLELAAVIAKLPTEQQHLIYLKYYQELKNEEIAKEFNIPEGTVKSRLHATLRKLRSLFSEEGR